MPPAKAANTPLNAITSSPHLLAGSSDTFWHLGCLLPGLLLAAAAGAPCRCGPVATAAGMGIAGQMMPKAKTKPALLGLCPGARCTGTHQPAKQSDDKGVCSAPGKRKSDLVQDKL